MYAQIAKDEHDLYAQRDKEWQDFLKFKRQAINEYGDTDKARLVYEDRETALLAKFNQQQEQLEARALERWEVFHNGGPSDTPIQEAEEQESKEVIQDRPFENTARAFEADRADMLGKRAELDPSAPVKTNTVEKTADVFKQLLQEEQTKQQEPQIDKESIKTINIDKAYNKTVTVEMNGIREETKQERIDRKMREWDAAQQDKTKQRSKSQEM